MFRVYQAVKTVVKRSYSVPLIGKMARWAVDITRNLINRRARRSGLEQINITLQAISRVHHDARSTPTVSVASSSSPLRVSFLTPKWSRNDAMGKSFGDKVEVLEDYCAKHEIPLDLRKFVGSSDYEQPGLIHAGSAADVVRHPHFMKSDLIIYEFGIYYDAFNSLLVAPRSARTLIHYHNVTTPALFPSQKGLLEDSLDQRSNFFYADKIMVPSPFNLRGVLDLGVPEERTAFVPYAVSPNRASTNKMWSNGSKSDEGTTHLLFVGRFVESKGVKDLVSTIDHIIGGGVSKVKLHLIGNEVSSDPGYMREIKHMISARHLREAVDYIGTVPNQNLPDYYASADALVIPSYHEGFCIPVIEAYAQGTYVIAYEAGNLPDTVGGLGTLVQAGDLVGLQRAIEDLCGRKKAATGTGNIVTLKTEYGEMGLSEYRRQAMKFAQAFSVEGLQERFISAIDLHSSLRR